MTFVGFHMIVYEMGQTSNGVMDDLESELRVLGELGENDSSDDESINRKRIKQPNLPRSQLYLKTLYKIHFVDEYVIR